jgi:hypothetical protein
MGGTQKRNKDSIFYEGDAVCHTCHQHECQCDANSRRAPDAPAVSNFGLWKNSILAGKEQKAKKKAAVKESVTDYNPPSQGGTRKELLAKLRSAKTAAERSDLATRARKAGASQDELMSAQSGHVKTKKRDGHTEFKGMDAAILRSKGLDESATESWSIRFMDDGKEERMTVKAATNREALKKWRAKKPDAEIIGISRAKQVDEGDSSSIISTLRSSWNSIERIDNDGYDKLVKLLNSLPQERLQDLADAKIKFVSSLARNRIKKSVDEAREDGLADLSKISTAKLQELVSLHRHYGGNNPLAAKAAKRGAEELLKRGIRVPVDEAEETNELDRPHIQQSLKNMADRHGKEEWSIEQLKALGKKLSGGDKKSQRVDELGNSLMPGGQRALNLAEQDFILNPHDVRRAALDIVPKVDPRQDREIEMACSDLYQSAKNAREVMELIKNIPETVGLEGWVQEKIIKASDYLNTVREYIESQQVRDMSDPQQIDEVVPEIMGLHGVIGGGLAAAGAGAATGTAIVGVTLLINEIKKKAVELAKRIKGGDEGAENAADAVAAEIKDEVSESATAALLAAGGATAASMLARKLISMIQDVRDRVQDNRYEKQRLEAELAKVEKYLAGQGA